MLEWVTEGTVARTGERLKYEGVSVMEVADDHIRRFHAYFNPTQLGVSTMHVAP